MFEVAHGYQVLKGWVDANSKEEAVEKNLNKEWTSIRGTFDVDVFTKDMKSLIFGKKDEQKENVNI